MYFRRCVREKGRGRERERERHTYIQKDSMTMNCIRQFGKKKGRETLRWRVRGTDREGVNGERERESERGVVQTGDLENVGVPWDDAH